MEFSYIALGVSFLTLILNLFNTRRQVIKEVKEDYKADIKELKEKIERLERLLTDCEEQREQLQESHYKALQRIFILENAK